MPGSKQFLRVICEYDHTNYYEAPTPQIGELLFCKTCDDFRKVKDVPDYWVVRCVQPHVNRNCFVVLRLSITAAQKSGAAHGRSKRHALTIAHDGRVVMDWNVDLGDWEPRLTITEARALRKEADK